MSKLGYIYDSYGKQFNISIANTYSYNVLSGSNLPINSIIICSNIDDNGRDIGTYSLLATDNYGNPIRLTYTIKEGNGLYYDENHDYIELNIDNDTIIDGNDGLKFEIKNHLGKDFIYIDSKNFTVNKDRIPNSSTSISGISSIDGKTIKSDNGNLFVDTSKLTYSNNATNQYGTVIGDNDTIYVDNGIVSLNVNNIKKANKENFGLASGDNYTVNIEDGIISVITENLNTATSSNLGISKPDFNTIVLNENEQITVNENNLKIASPYDYGVAKIDINTLDLSDDKRISMKNYNLIKESIQKYNDISLNYKNKINDYIEYLSSGNILLKKNDIILFSITETSVTELEKPKKDEEVINMPLQFTSATFDIITTCDFILSILFEQGTNEFPNVDIVEVNYNDERIYTKEEALDPLTVYPSTNGDLKRLTIKFSGKNFRNTTKGYSLVTSVDILVSDSIDHLKIKHEKYSIIRYNSIYDESYRDKEESKESHYILVENSVKWAPSRLNNQ